MSEGLHEKNPAKLPMNNGSPISATRSKDGAFKDSTHRWFLFGVYSSFRCAMPWEIYSECFYGNARNTSLLHYEFVATFSSLAGTMRAFSPGTYLKVLQLRLRGKNYRSISSMLPDHGKGLIFPTSEINILLSNQKTWHKLWYVRSPKQKYSKMNLEMPKRKMLNDTTLKKRVL